MENDLKKYEVPISDVPIWYHETIKEFIVYHCDDMDIRNKLILLELLEKVSPKILPALSESKVVKLRKSA